jgi:hypothetical protein
VFQASVDGLGGAVAGAWSVEVGQYVDGSLLQGPTQRDELGQRLRNPTAERIDQVHHQLAATDSVGLPVGGDHALVDAPGRFDLDVRVVGEQRLEPLLLFVGEQVGAGVQGAAGPVERIVGAAAVAVDDLLDPAATLVQGIAGEADDVEGVHHRNSVGQFLGGGGLEPGEAVHRDDLDTVTPGWVAFGEPPLEGLFGTALDHVDQPGGAGVVADRGEVDDHGDVLVTAAGVPPDVLIDA